MKVTAVISMAGLALPPVTQAQEPNQPFQLHVQKHDYAEQPSPAAAPLRILRDQLNLNSQVPMVAPPIKGGAKADSGAFGLHAQDFALPGKAEAARLAPFATGAQTAPLKGAATFAKTLANFDIELIVDQSLSMRQRDCPGGMSRWEWCGAQLGNLSRQLTPYTPRGFSLTTFAGDFQTYQGATADQVQQLFQFPEFSRGTRLSEPLNARLNNYFANRRAGSKPLLIVVITDGVPAPRMEPGKVAQTLINASKLVKNPNEITVVFFQIGGGDRFGRYFLDEMDNDLVEHGARFDIVRTVYFEQLEQQGLTQSLVASVKNFAQQAAR
jgi:hypothetical protein